MPFNGMSPSGDVEAEVVYANYGTPDDFQKLEQMKIDVRGKIVLVRYGQNFRGVKAFVAQEHGAAGVLIYSDPADDGWRHGDKYPQGPWRPDTGVQRGSIGYMFQFPGDPTTPGIASLPSLARFQTHRRRNSRRSCRKFPRRRFRTPTPGRSSNIWADRTRLATGKARCLSPITSGPGPIKVKMHLKQDYQFRTIWDVIGRVRGSELPDEWVVAGNHRDAWVYGAVDPNSGTAAMLESVHGIGELLKSGWKPKRTIVFGSWDAEEEGLIGSTEWGEQHEAELAQRRRLLQHGRGGLGPEVRRVVGAHPETVSPRRDARSCPAPRAACSTTIGERPARREPDADEGPRRILAARNAFPPRRATSDVSVGDLGSGSDYTVFLQHLGVPSSDVSSTGIVRRLSLGLRQLQLVQEIWRSRFHLRAGDGARLRTWKPFAWPTPTCCPTTTRNTARKSQSTSMPPEGKSEAVFGGQSPNFAEAIHAAHQFEQAGAKMLRRQKNPGNDATRAQCKPASGGTRPADS